MSRSRTQIGVTVKPLVLIALIAAALAAAITAAAVALGWSPGLWLLIALPVVVGLAAFLVAGRVRAVRHKAERRRRAQMRRRVSASAFASPTSDQVHLDDGSTLQLARVRSDDTVGH